MFDVLNAKADLLTAVKKLNDKYELSKVVGEDYYNPGMMENLDCYLGTYNESDDIVTIRTESKGLRYENRTPRLDTLSVGDTVRIVRDQENQYNNNNFVILNCNGESLGTLSAELCNVIAPLFDNDNLVFDNAKVSYLERIRDRRRYAKQGILFVELRMKLQNIPKQIRRTVTDTVELPKHKEPVNVFDEPISIVSDQTIVFAENNSAVEAESVEYGSLQEVVEAIKKKYEKRPNEKSLNEIFANNPEFEKYHYKLSVQAINIFGMRLERYFEEIGLLENKTIVEASPQSAVPVFGEQPQPEPVVVSLDTVSASAIIDVPAKVVTPEVTETEALNASSIMVLTQQEETAIKVENERTLKLLESIFSKHRVNISHIEGTSLYKRLKEASINQHFKDIKAFLTANGFIVDDDAKESFKLSFNRIYNRRK